MFTPWILLCSKCVSFFPRHQAILQCSVDTSWVSYTLVQFWHCLPGVSADPPHRLGLSPKRLPLCPPRFGCQVQTVTCASDRPPINGTSQDPFLGFGNLLELQKTFTCTELMYNKSCIKGYRWMAGWTDTQDGLWKGPRHGHFCPHGAVLLPSWHVDVSRHPPDPVLWGFCAGFVT